jgi:PAS domain S-box-containing protein
MNYTNLSAFCAMAGIINMLLVYIYLYALYRERYMGIWIITWLGFALRLIFFDSGIFDWKQSLVGFIIYELIYISTILLFLWGQYLFVGRPLKRRWLYCAAVVFTLSAGSALLNLSFFFKHIFSALYAGAILTSIGISFIYDLKIKGIGSRITGYAFILWGILTATTPYTLGLELAWVTPMNYFIGGFLRLIIASGSLLVYFEKTRADLLNREAYYRLVTENVVDVIYRYKLLPEPKFEYISPSVLAATGYSPAEFYADTSLMSKIIHSNDLPLYEDLIANPWKYNYLSLTLRLIRKDKQMIWIEKKCVLNYDEKENLHCLNVIIRDVTARKELEQLTARTEKLNMVGEMAANVAHEIRNPLTTVRGYLQLMARKPEFNNYQQRFDLILEELDRTNSIISEYLLLAKDKRVELKSCCLNTIVKKLFPLIQADANASNVAVTLSLKDIQPLYLDENEIRQLILNLIRNGIEAMPNGGQLTISTRVKKNQVILAIHDQGSGMPDHILENLGMPFFTTKDTGTGLGLPICYRIAARHNAHINVRSGNHGTTFFVCFSPLQLIA